MTSSPWPVGTIRRANELTTRADPETVIFADRRLERAWQRRMLGYGDIAPA
jgi:hypothetical protein